MAYAYHYFKKAPESRSTFSNPSALGAVYVHWHSGLSVLASTRCGCVLDLVHPGVNGWVVDPFNEMSIADGLARLSSELTDTKAMGKASKSIVVNYTPQTWADALSDCISFAMSEHR